MKTKKKKHQKKVITEDPPSDYVWVYHPNEKIIEPKSFHIVTPDVIYDCRELPKEG
jgi:hypothetical protein